MKKSLLVMAIAAGSIATAANAQITVELELSLLNDVSGSVDGNEFNLVRTAYRNVFTNPSFYNGIVGAGNSIAVNYIEWSGANQQNQVVGWTVINSQASANAFAALVGAAPRSFSGQTAPGSAINFAYPLIFNNNINSTRQVIDVSGDGTANEGANTAAARDAAIAAGVDQINGLAIGGAAIEAWYNANVRSANGLVLPAATFAAFEDALRRKIQIEVQGVPLPTAAGMGMLGMGLLTFRRRRSA